MKNRRGTMLKMNNAFILIFVPPIPTWLLKGISRIPQKCSYFSWSCSSHMSKEFWKEYPFMHRCFGIHNSTYYYAFKRSMGSSWKTRKKCVDPFIVVHDETKIVCIRTDFIVYKICIILAAAMGWQGR